MNKTKKRIAWAIAGAVLVSLIVTIFFQFVRPSLDLPRCNSIMKGIPIAFHCYHDEYGVFPPAYTVDDDGKRLHSWRTLLLPYLGQKELYEQIRLDEPWDSEHNRRFHDRFWFNWQQGACDCCCPVMRRYLPKDKRGGQFTNYMVVIGPGLMFDGSKEATLPIRGNSNTILLVEANMAIHWMCPVDMPVEALRHGFQSCGSGVLGIGGIHLNGATLFALADGSVHAETESTLSSDLLPKLFRKDGDAVYPW